LQKVHRVTQYRTAHGVRHVHTGRLHLFDSETRVELNSVGSLVEILECLLNIWVVAKVLKLGKSGQLQLGPEFIKGTALQFATLQNACHFNVLQGSRDIQSITISETPKKRNG
jgi:hypothetical protein